MRHAFHPCRGTRSLILLAALLVSSEAGGQSLSTWAGTGVAGYSGDGGAPTSAGIRYPAAVWGDTSGAVFIADTGNHCIRRVSSAGDTISTVAGTGTGGFSGDGGAGTSAQLNSPGGVFVDSTGAVYVADTGNHRVRKITGTTITTIAGTGTAGFSGDDSAATSARLNAPAGVFVRGGAVYIVDAGNHRIRKITGTTITTIAGTGAAGYNGDDSTATRARLNAPAGVAVDSAGAVYIADTGNHRIRRVTGTTIVTIAGTGVPGFTGDGDLPTRAQLAFPKAVCLDSAGAVYIADNFSHRIRRINPSGNITTLVGNGAAGYGGDTTAAHLASLSSPSGVFVDRLGQLYLADTGNHRLRRLSVGDTRGLSGTGRVAPGDQALILTIAYAGDGGTGVTSVSLTVSDLSASTGLASSEFAYLKLYESADSLLSSSDFLIGSLAGSDLVLGRPATIQANPIAWPGYRVRRYYLVAAQIAATATQGHAFRVGFAPGGLATTKGGRGSRVAARDTDRMDVDVVATRLLFTTEPGGAISSNPLQVQPVVAAVDDSGRVDRSFTDVVTLTTTGPGALFQNQVTASAGVAAFTNLSYVATADEETFTLVADDQATGSEGDLPVTASKTLEANSLNTAPRVDFFSLIMREDESFTTSVSSLVSDADDTSFTFTFLSHHILGRVAQGQVTIYPEKDWYGLDTLTIVAADPFGAQGSDRRVIEVRPVDDPPVLSLPDTLSFLEDDTLEIDLLSRVYDPDTPLSQLKWNLISSPGLTADLDPVTGLLRAWVAPDSSGSFRLILQTSDLSFGVGQDTVLLVVRPVSDPPRLAIPDTSLLQATTLTLDLKRYASDIDDPLSRLAWTAGSLRLNAAVSSSGALTLTPDPGFFGVDTLVVTATDPQNAAGRDTVVVRVVRVNRPPVLQAIPDTAMAAGAAIAWNLQSYASDPDDPPAALGWSASGALRTQASMAGSVLRLTAATGPAYVETLRVQVQDPAGLAASRFFAVRVRVLPRLVAGMPDTSFAPGDSVWLALDRYADARVPPSSLVWTAQPATDLRVAIDQVTRRATISVRAGWKGQGRVVFYASQPGGESGADTLMATVTNPSPSVDLPDLFLDQGASAQLQLDAHARDDEPVSRLSWSAQPEPGVQVSLNRVLRQATLIASSRASGRVLVAFRAVDLQGAAAADTVVVTIRARADTAAPADTSGGALPDTTGSSPDTTATPGDTTSTAPPDTAVSPPDTTGASPDTTTAPADTTVTAPPDTAAAPPDTTGAPPDTTTAPTDTTVAAPPDTTGPGATPNRAPVLGELPTPTLGHGATVRLALDPYVQDEAPVASLAWVARSDSGLQVSIDPATRIATLQALSGFSGRVRLYLQVSDSQGATTASSTLVEVLPAPAAPVAGDFDGSGRPDLSDFFSLVDQMGLHLLHPDWDPRYDLDGDGRVTIEDFFLFADLLAHSQVPSRSRP